MVVGSLLVSMGVMLGESEREVGAEPWIMAA